MIVEDGRGRGTSSRGSVVYEMLLAKIRNRELRPGTRLREADLAEEMGVSRTPVREALARLQARGLTQTILGGQTIVELDRGQIMELYDMRGMLEGAAARFAAESASPTDIAGLQLVLKSFQAFQGTPDQFAQLNRQLHNAIYEASHNRYLLRALGELLDSKALMPDTTFSYENRTDESRQEHAQIIEAIVAREPDKAEAAARHHILRARDARLNMLFAQSSN